MKKAWLCTLVFAVSLSLQAEMRAWTDKTGRQFQAEYVREIFGIVLMDTLAGERISVAFDQLSSPDQVYLRKMIPPELGISFSKRTVKKTQSAYTWWYDETVFVTGEISIRKISEPPYTGVLFAEVFMIGKEVVTGNYALLEKKTESFSLKNQEGKAYQFEITVESRRYQEYNNQTRGVQFIGYAVVVEDGTGNRVAMQSDLKWVTAEKIAELRKFDTSSFFNENCREVPVPRPAYYTERTTW
jgi:hypothetical protein